MKIALAQQNYIVGNFDYNTGLIRDAIVGARKLGADLVIFSELSVCGYPPRDFLEFTDFQESCTKAIEQIAGDCNGIAAIVGAPGRNPGEKGKPLYNTAWFLADGKVAGMAHKTLLPTYDVFDEYRYFEPNRMPYQVIDYLGKRFALTICEDLWNVDNYPLYVRNPMEELSTMKPDVIINIAASPFHYNQPEIRLNILSHNAKQYNLPLFYVNQTGGQTELLFDGGSLVMDAGGSLYDELPRFEEALRVYDLEELGNLNTNYELRITNRSEAELGEANYETRHSASLSLRGTERRGNSIQLIHSALVMGIRDYFSKMGFSKAILGLSGGIDSAVTLVLATEALGSENVKALLLPSRYSSEHSIADARKLAENTNVSYDIIPIDESFTAVESTMSPYFTGLSFNVAEENIQARLRAVILMAMANKFGYILLNTSNKSEAAVGYGTLYGDMCGGISVLGDLYKTQVYELARHINRVSEMIPVNTIDKPPSAELRPDQKDADSLPEYALLDKILYHYIEERKGPKEITALGFDPAVVTRVLSLVNGSEWKRHQTPPILRVSPKAFGVGRRMPIVGKYL
ncbi:MAG: NAD+ synthase [Bacteroidales bacterium]|nr:NAD+ synthase [Bacteroidales bacterium]